MVSGNLMICQKIIFKYKSDQPKTAMTKVEKSKNATEGAFERDIKKPSKLGKVIIE